MNTGGGRLTVEEYRQRPEEAGVQLIDGSLAMAPSPTLFHQDIVRNLVVLLVQHVRAHGLGRVCVAPLDVYLSGRDVLEPDVMFVANENAAILQADGVHGAPDLVIEVLSPTTARLDSGRKRELYRLHGVKELWLVDPLRRQIQRHDFRHHPEPSVESIGEAGSFASPLLPGLTIPAVEVFRN